MNRLFTIFLLVFALATGFAANAQTLNAPPTVADFTLASATGDSVRLSDAANNKAAMVVIFTGNHCVYSKKYEDRILALARKYGDKVGFLLINPNNPDVSEYDTPEAMQARAEEKNYPCPYLKDYDAAVAKAFHAEKIPSAFVLVPGAEGRFDVVFSGKIDNNPLLSDAADKFYVAETLDLILAGKRPEYQRIPETGCLIKVN